MKKLSLDELDRITVDEYRNAPKTRVCIVLDNIRSLHNVGSAFRTGDAFRIEKIFLTGITGVPPHREIEKTALGATSSVPWEYCENPIDAVNRLRAEGYTIAVVEQTNESVSLHKFVPAAETAYCLVFGNEVHGVSAGIIDNCDLALEIPQAGTKHSLNISVCLGIVVWHFFQKKLV